MNKEKMNEEQRKEVVTDIAEKFVTCDQYSKGFIAGFIEAVQATKKNDNDTMKLQMRASIQQ